MQVHRGSDHLCVEASGAELGGEEVCRKMGVSHGIFNVLKKRAAATLRLQPAQRASDRGHAHISLPLSVGAT